MKYAAATIFCGTIWAITGVALGEEALGGGFWQLLVAGILSGVFLSYLFRRLITTLSGAKWFLFPLFTILCGTTLCGFICALLLYLTTVFSTPNGMELEIFSIALVFPIYALTIYLLPLYPLALLTQYILRKIAQHELAVDGRPAAGLRPLVTQKDMNIRH